MDKIEMFVVTKYSKEIEPIVTIFNNEEAANRCAEYFKKHQRFKVCIDKCPVYTTFRETEG